MKYQYGDNLFHEIDLQKKLVELTGKWVVHLIATGLRDNPDRSMDFMNFYADKTENVDILNALYNAPSDRKELYVLIDNDTEARYAYERWFPTLNDFVEGEEYLYVEMIFMGPNGKFFTNGKVDIDYNIEIPYED